MPLLVVATVRPEMVTGLPEPASAALSDPEDPYRPAIAPPAGTPPPPSSPSSPPPPTRTVTPSVPVSPGKSPVSVPKLDPVSDALAVPSYDLVTEPCRLALSAGGTNEYSKPLPRPIRDAVPLAPYCLKAAGRPPTVSDAGSAEYTSQRALPAVANAVEPALLMNGPVPARRMMASPTVPEDDN